jgi:hypothetical protein
MNGNEQALYFLFTCHAFEPEDDHRHHRSVLTHDRSGHVKDGAVAGGR